MEYSICFQIDLNGFFKDLVLKISSLRFAILLIIFIAFSSAFGTFIPENNKQEYIEIYNKNPIFGFITGNEVLKLQLDHVYTRLGF